MQRDGGTPHVAVAIGLDPVAVVVELAVEKFIRLPGGGLRDGPRGIGLRPGALCFAGGHLRRLESRAFRLGFGALVFHIPLALGKGLRAFCQRLFLFLKLPLLLGAVFLREPLLHAALDFRFIGLRRFGRSFLVAGDERQEGQGSQQEKGFFHNRER